MLRQLIWVLFNHNYSILWLQNLEEARYAAQKYAFKKYNYKNNQFARWIGPV